MKTDVVIESECRNLIAQTTAEYGRIDTLLYNAGRGYPRRFESLPGLDTVRSEIALNYLGMVCCARYALPHLRQSRGRIAAVSSFGALVGLPGTAGYNSSKHALRGFMNSLRVELLGSGVTVTSLYLGAVRTARLAREARIERRNERSAFKIAVGEAVVVVPTHPRVQREVWPNLPGILKIQADTIVVEAATWKTERRLFTSGPQAISKDDLVQREVQGVARPTRRKGTSASKRDAT